MNSNELKKRLEQLDSRKFLKDGKLFFVTGVEYYMDKYRVRTDRQIFVMYPNEFELFLTKITPVDNEYQQKVFVPDETILTSKNEQMEENKQTAITALVTSSDSVTQVSALLLDQFKKLAGDPSDENIKVSGALGELAKTMCVVEQTKINSVNLALRLQNGR